MELAITPAGPGDLAVLAVRGEIDLESAPALKDALCELLATDVDGVMVDLSGVGFLDSTGLGALVAARTVAAQHDRSLAIVCDNDRIVKLFSITGLDGVFSIHRDVAAARTSLSNS